MALLLFEMEQEDFILTRIRRHAKKCKETQESVYEALAKIVFAISKVCYIDNKPVFRILYRSIYLMLYRNKDNGKWLTNKLRNSVYLIH